MSFDQTSPFQHRLVTSLTIWYAITFIAGTIICFSVLYVVIKQSLIKSMQSEIIAELTEYGAAFNAEGLKGVEAKSRYERDAQGIPIVFIEVTGSDGNPLFQNDIEHWSGYHTQGLFELRTIAENDWIILKHEGARHELHIKALRLNDQSELFIGAINDEIIEALNSLQFTFMVLTCVVLPFALGVGWVHTNRALQRGREISATLSDIVRTGNVHARFPESTRQDEFGELQSLINGLLARIETLISAMRGSLDNIAHELRTPLTRLRSSAELALLSPADGERQKEALILSVEETERILTLLSQFMDISESESGLLRLSKSHFKIDELLQDAVEMYGLAAGERNISLRLDRTVDLSLTADKDRLFQAVCNVIDNAIKYSPNGSEVLIQSSLLSASELAIRVIDPGLGIAADEIELLCDRLYRGKAGRTQPGLGLGLSLVKAILVAHGGRLEISSTPGSGSAFTLILPVL